MPALSIADLRKLQHNQFGNIKKYDLIDAILAVTSEDLGTNGRLEVWLAEISKEMMELKLSVQSSNDGVNKKMKAMKEKIGDAPFW